MTNQCDHTIVADSCDHIAMDDFFAQIDVASALFQKIVAPIGKNITIVAIDWNWYHDELNYCLVVDYSEPQYQFVAQM